MRGVRRKRRVETVDAPEEETRASRPLRKRDMVLAIVLSDSTFVRSPRHGDRGEAWVGKCIHCGAHLIVSTDGEPVSRATIEHILPKSHGGGDDLANVALACARCNSLKGVRHDTRRKGDPELARLVQALLEKRRARWREPPP